MEEAQITPHSAHDRSMGDKGSWTECGDCDQNGNLRNRVDCSQKDFSQTCRNGALRKSPHSNKVATAGEGYGCGKCAWQDAKKAAPALNAGFRDG